MAIPLFFFRRINELGHKVNQIFWALWSRRLGCYHATTTSTFKPCERTKQEEIIDHYGTISHLVFFTFRISLFDLDQQRSTVESIYLFKYLQTIDAILIGNFFFSSSSSLYRCRKKKLNVSTNNYYGIYWNQR